MIRPFTFVCLLLAGGAGLYLYQVKHRTRLLEIEIDRTLHDATKVREQTGLLQAEWAFLNDPSRLQALADQQLSLKPMDSRQFVQMSDLDRHLPAVPAPEAPTPPADVATVTEAAPPPPPPPIEIPVIAAPPPKPPPPPAQVATAMPTPPPRRPPAVHRTPPPATPLPVAAARLPRYTPYAAASVEPQPVIPPVPVAGSALGSFHATLPPPVPIATTSPASFHEPKSGR